MNRIAAWVARRALAVVISRDKVMAHSVVSWAAGELAHGTCWTAAVKTRAADAWVRGGA